MIITCPACATQFRVDGTKISAAGTKVRCARCSHIWLQTPDKALPYPGARQAAPTAPAQKPRAPKPAPPAAAASPQPPSVPQAEPPRPVPAKSQPPAVPAPQPVREARVPAPDSARPKAAPPPPRPKQAPDAPAGRSLPRVLLFASLGVALLAACLLVYGVLHYRTAIANHVPFLAKFYALIDLPVEVTGLNVQDVTYKRTFEDGVPWLEVRGDIINVTNKALAVPRIRAALRDRTGKELYVWTFAPPTGRLEPKQSSSFISRLPSPPPDAATLAVSFVKAGGH